MVERAIRAVSAVRAQSAVPIASAVPLAKASAEWVRDEGALWPWVGRFLWSPAPDLHPTRRESLLPGWPQEVWSDPRSLAHVSRHLLTAHGLLEIISASAGAAAGSAKTNSVSADAAARSARTNSASPDATARSAETTALASADSEFLLALLPQAPLARLARRIGLALHGADACGSLTSLDEDERLFLTRRVPLYWHTPPVSGDDPDATGWRVLHTLTENQPDGVRRRFAWKTPLEAGRPAISLPGSALLHGLIRKVLKEFESPWSSLFATLRRPGCQIRLHG